MVMDALAQTKDPHRVAIGRMGAGVRWQNHDTRTLRLGDLPSPMAAAIRQLVQAAREGDAALAARASNEKAADVLADVSAAKEPSRARGRTQH